MQDAVVMGAGEEGGGETELEEAEEEVQAAERGGKIGGRQTALQRIAEVASIIFVAEWGDRSMLATIALVGPPPLHCPCAHVHDLKSLTAGPRIAAWSSVHPAPVR